MENKRKLLDYEFNIKSFSTIEIVFSITIFAFAVLGLSGYLSASIQGFKNVDDYEKAVLLANEGLEVSRDIRNQDYAMLINGNFGITQTSNKWGFVANQDITGIYTRQLTISTIDSTTKKIVSTVKWNTPQKTFTAVTYLTNWTRTIAGNWQSPLQDGSLNLTGSDPGVEIRASGNYAYVVRQGTSSNFTIVNVTNPASPTLSSTMTLSGTPWYLTLDGNYVYVLTRGTPNKVIIINVTNPISPSIAGTYNLTGTNPPFTCTLVGDLLYVVAQNTGTGANFFVINVGTPASPYLVSTLSTNDYYIDIRVQNNYAFVSSTANNRELQVFNVSDPANPSRVQQVNMPGTSGGFAIQAFTNRLLFTNQSGEMDIVNISNPLNPTIIGSYQAGGRIGAISLGFNDSFAFLGTTNSSREFQIVNITNQTTPVLHGSFNFSGEIYGMAYDPLKDRAYTVGSDTSKELQIFKPSP